MAGTTGLEPATSAVTVLHSEVFQRLTNPWGTPKTTEVVLGSTFCGLDCGSGIESKNGGRIMVPDHLTAIWRRANSAEEIGLKTRVRPWSYLKSYIAGTTGSNPRPLP